MAFNRMTLSPPHCRTFHPHSNPTITSPPLLHDLLRRDIATCGYISGNPSLPLTCPSGYTCTSTVHFFAQWACCNAIECTADYVTCANYGSQICPGLDSSACSSIYTSFLSCSDTANPSCFVYERTASLGDSSTVISYGCGPNGQAVLALATTTDSDGMIAGAASTTTSSYDDFAGTENGALPSSTVDATQPSSSSSSTSTGSGGGGLSTSGIIGIALGAVSAISALVGVHWKWKDRKKAKAAKIGPAPQNGPFLHHGLTYGQPPAYMPMHSMRNEPHVYGNGWR